MSELPVYIDGGTARNITLPFGEPAPGYNIVTLIPTESAVVVHDWDGKPLTDLKPSIRRTFRRARGRWRCIEDRRARIAAARRQRRRKHGWR